VHARGRAGWQISVVLAGALLTRYLWTGRELDTLTGLQYNRNRWYDPTLGRWVSEGPIGFWGGDYHLSRYVSNEPTRYVDVDGLGIKVPDSMLPDGWQDMTKEEKQAFVDKQNAMIFGMASPWSAGRAGAGRIVTWIKSCFSGKTSAAATTTVKTLRRYFKTSIE
jgi:RHS repeat-associated protein